LPQPSYIQSAHCQKKSDCLDNGLSTQQIEQIIHSATFLKDEIHNFLIEFEDGKISTMAEYQDCLEKISEKAKSQGASGPMLVIISILQPNSVETKVKTD
jgi:hypothetical protein